MTLPPRRRADTRSERPFDERGSSLAEVLVALLLIAVTVMAAAPMFVSSARLNRAGGDSGWIGAAATARLEQLRSRPFHELVPGGSLSENEAGYFDDADPRLTVRWEIVDGGGPAGTKTIRVRADSLRREGGRPMAVELTTLRVR